MTLTLSKDTIQWLLEMQEKFDSKLRADKNIDYDVWTEELDDNHQLAFSVEVHEFINEWHDVWKYWKSKPINLHRVLDEAIDVIHFSALIFNKSGDTAEILAKDLDMLEKLRSQPKKALKNMSQNPKIVIVLSEMLGILDHYGFTEQDIIEQYKRKNAINFERLESGY